MKKIIKYFLLITFVLLTHNYLWHNLTFNQGLATILKVAAILTVFEIILKPVIKILLLPINLLTLGLIRFLIDTLGLYLAIFLVADFSLAPISTNPVSFSGVSLPAFHFSHFSSILVSSISISFILNFYNLILSKK